MHSFKELSDKFNKAFEAEHFPASPASLYEPGNYFLSIGGKRIRPVMCLLGNELFSEIHPDAYQIANAVELIIDSIFLLNKALNLLKAKNSKR